MSATHATCDTGSPFISTWRTSARWPGAQFTITGPDDVAGVAADAYAPAGVQSRPVSYSTSANGYESSRSNLTERRVVYQQPTTERVQKRSSWKKPLLVIGGSTAAGAGIGGLVGGKKGALIGAALGGGASTLYEATRK